MDIYNTIYYLDGKETDGMFYAKELQKTNQTEFRIEKVINTKSENFMLRGNVIIIHSIAGLIQNIVK